jgi:hypothetical protein
MRKTSTRASVVLVAVVVLTTACGRLADGQDRAGQAWSDRLSGQAQAIQQDDARRDRAHEAYTARMLAAATAQRDAQSRRQRAMQAWSERLNGLAEGAAGAD